jgi:uncharacterized protein (DUF433 family)
MAPKKKVSANNKAALLKRITVDSGKCGGRPCLRETRMPVVDILQLWE